MFPITSSCGCAAMSIAPACLIESISAESSLTVAVETRRCMISRVLRVTSCDATCWRRRSSAMNREHSPATFGLIGGVAVALIGLAGALSTWHDLAAPAFSRRPRSASPRATGPQRDPNTPKFESDALVDERRSQFYTIISYTTRQTQL